MISKLEMTAYLALLFPPKIKPLPSVYQISSGFVRGSSDNPSWGFVPKRDKKPTLGFPLKGKKDIGIL